MSYAKQDFSHKVNMMRMLIDNQINRLSTATIVQVTHVDTKNHTLDASLLVQMLNNDGNTKDHAPIHNIPYVRLQGGRHGIICDPMVGDVGLVVFCSRDINNVKKNKKKSPPASWRTYSISDGIYIASLLLDDPITYIHITEEKIIIKAPTVEINGDVEITGNAVIGGISFKDHIHGNGNNGDDTFPPN